MPLPPPDKRAGDGVRLRQPSRPEIRHAISGDDAPERLSITHDAFDGAPQALPVHRKGTLLGMPKAPPLPIEYGATLRAPSTTAVTAPAPAPTSIRIPADARPSLAPPSASPDAAALAASRADGERLRLKVAELERDARAVADTRTVSYPPRVERSPTPPVVSIPPDGSVASLRKAITRLVLGVAALLALLGAPLAIWVSNIAAEAKARSERASAQVAQASSEADAAKSKASTNAKDAAATDREFRQFRSNMRELMRLQGVEIPKTEGDPEPADLKPYARLCPQGRVCTGAQLILTRGL